jgi:hypothetical protein
MVAIWGLLLLKSVIESSSIGDPHIASVPPFIANSGLCSIQDFVDCGADDH